MMGGSLGLWGALWTWAVMDTRQYPVAPREPPIIERTPKGTNSKGYPPPARVIIVRGPLLAIRAWFVVVPSNSG